MSTFRAIRLSLKATQQVIADFLDCTLGNVALYDRRQTVPLKSPES